MVSTQKSQTAARPATSKSRHATHEQTDPVNTMDAETSAKAALGLQQGGGTNRWGDYSTMTLDPVGRAQFVVRFFIITGSGFAVSPERSNALTHIR